MLGWKPIPDWSLVQAVWRKGGRSGACQLWTTHAGSMSQLRSLWSGRLQFCKLMVSVVPDPLRSIVVEPALKHITLPHHGTLNKYTMTKETTHCHFTSGSWTVVAMNPKALLPILALLSSIPLAADQQASDFVLWLGLELIFQTDNILANHMESIEDVAVVISIDVSCQYDTFETTWNYNQAQQSPGWNLFGKGASFPGALGCRLPWKSVWCTLGS